MAYLFSERYCRPLSLDTQHRLWETAHVRKTRNDIASGGGTETIQSSVPDPRVSMAPNFKLIDF